MICSKNPCYESYLIADYVSKFTGYPTDVSEQAGGSHGEYSGCVEDWANLNLVPSVTLEVLSNHRNVEYGAPEVSYNQMLGFLNYFGINVTELIDIPLPLNSGSYDLTVEYLGAYNYNPSSKTLKKVIIVPDKPNPNPNPQPKPNPVDNESKVNTLVNAGNPLLVLLISLFSLAILGFRRY